jgi:hypothetical protein
MTNNLRLISFTILLVVLGCRSNLEWKGTLKGTFEIEDYKTATSSVYPRPAPIDSGTGSAEIYTGLKDHLRLGKDTPLPGCTLTMEVFQGQGKETVEYKVVDADKAHIGDTADGTGCRGRIDKSGELVDIDIDHATVALHSDGTFYVGVDYRSKLPDPLDYGGKARVLKITGNRGWF